MATLIFQHLLLILSVLLVPGTSGLYLASCGISVRQRRLPVCWEMWGRISFRQAATVQEAVRTRPSMYEPPPSLFNCSPWTSDKVESNIYSTVVQALRCSQVTERTKGQVTQPYSLVKTEKWLVDLLDVMTIGALAELPASCQLINVHLETPRIYLSNTLHETGALLDLIG